MPTIDTWPTTEPPTPEPATVVVCSVCRQPWDDHLARARYWDDEAEGYDPGNTGPSYRPVHLGDCLGLVVEAQRGPVGPTGPMGATGMSAPPASAAGTLRTGGRAAGEVI